MEPLTPEELRVVACLVEKAFTTPDGYPLTENAVVAACNQLSNRNPVVAYDNNTVRVTLTALRQRGLARVVHTPGARVPKHKHILDEALGLSRPEVSLLTVLALRGPQTVGELRTRTERMHDFSSLSEVEETLENLATRDEPFVVRLERQPGQKEARFAQLLGGPVDAGSSAYASPAPAAYGSSGTGDQPSPGAAAHGAPATVADAEAGWAEETRPAQATATDAGPSAPPSSARPAQATATDAGPSAPPSSAGPSAGDDRLAALETRLAAIEEELAILHAEHRELRDELGLGSSRPSGAPAGGEPVAASALRDDLDDLDDLDQ